MNILLTSAGRRTYLVDYFKKALGETGKVHVSNSERCPAFAAADCWVETPLIYDDAYIGFMQRYCVENDIKAIIPLFDIDIPILARNKASFERIGVTVVVPDTHVAELCNDKWQMFNHLVAEGIATPQTFLSVDDAMYSCRRGEVSFPLILKPRWGMGSIGMFAANNQGELEILYAAVLDRIKKSYLKYESRANIEQSVLIQETINGVEYGLDVMSDLGMKYQATSVKKKIAMRAGETDSAVTVRSELLESLGRSLALLFPHPANMDVDVFVTQCGPVVLELNARFGGGFPFSYAAGVDLPSAIVDWLNGDEIDASLLVPEPGIASYKDIVIRRDL